MNFQKHLIPLVCGSLAALRKVGYPKRLTQILNLFFRDVPRVSELMFYLIHALSPKKLLLGYRLGLVLLNLPYEARLWDATRDLEAIVEFLQESIPV